MTKKYFWLRSLNEFFQIPYMTVLKFATRMKVKWFFSLLAHALARENQENGISNKTIGTWWAALIANAVKHSLPNLRHLLLASNPFTTMVAQRLMSDSPDRALPIGVHASWRLVQEQDCGVAQHAHCEAQLQQGKGFESNLLQSLALCLQRAADSVASFMGIKVLIYRKCGFGKG